MTRRQLRGAEVFATELADGLAARGHEVILAGLYPHAAVHREPRLAGVCDLNVTVRRGLNPLGVAAVAAAIRRIRPDVVQANGSDTLKYCVLARAVAGGEWRLVYRNISMASQWLRHPLHRALNRGLVRRVDHVVSVSRASSRDFIETYGIERDRVSCIPRAVTLPEQPARSAARAALEAEAGVPPDAPLLMHVGSFTPEKNHGVLLDVFDAVSADQPDVFMVMVGDGPGRARVQEEVERRGHAGRIRLPGVRADAATLVAAADVFVLPSLVEGLPGVVLEAAAHGVPAVCTDVGGVREAVRDGRTGVLVPPGDAPAFARATAELLGDAARRCELGANARELVRSGFAMDSVVAKYEELYGRLCTDSAPALEPVGRPAEVAS